MRAAVTGLAGAGDRGDDAAAGVYLADAGGAGVADENIVARSVLHRPGIDQVGAQGRSPVAFVPLECRTRQVVDDTRFIDAANVTMSSVGDDYAASGVH